MRNKLVVGEECRVAPQTLLNLAEIMEMLPFDIVVESGNGASIFPKLRMGGGNYPTGIGSTTLTPLVEANIYFVRTSGEVKITNYAGRDYIADNLRVFTNLEIEGSDAAVRFFGCNKDTRISVRKTEKYSHAYKPQLKIPMRKLKLVTSAPILQYEYKGL